MPQLFVKNIMKGQHLHTKNRRLSCSQVSQCNDNFSHYILSNKSVKYFKSLTAFKQFSTEVFMYCYGMGQHKKYEEQNYTDLVCMVLPREVCNVTVDKQRFEQIDPTKRNVFCKCESCL